MVNIQIENYYSDDEFEYNCDDVESETEYDSGDDFYDELLLNPTKDIPLGGLVEGTSSEAWQSRGRSLSSPSVQLTSEKTKKEVGYETAKEFADYVDRNREEDRLAKLEEARVQREKQRESIEKKHEEDEAAWQLLKATLPTESAIGKVKRLMREENERQLKQKLNWIKKKSPNAPLSFAHRRNGGGKSRNKVVAEASTAAKRQEQITKERRARHRKLVKETKKREEAQRQLQFQSSPITVAEKVVQIDYVKEEEEIPVDEEHEQEINKLKEQEKAEELRVRELILKKIETPLPEIMEAPVPKKKADDGWQKIPKKKKSSKRVNVIKITTPKMIEEESRKARIAPRSSSTKSRMCISVSSGKTCPHGSRCRFAHSIEELNPVQCLFNRKCKNVENTPYGYVNVGTKKCCFQHTGETKEAYCKRLGYKFNVAPQKKPEVVVPKSNPWKVVEPKRKPQVKQMRICRSVETGQPCPHGDKCRFSHVKPQVVKPQVVKPQRICRSVETGQPCPHGDKRRFSHETVIRVPKALAVKAAEIAIKRGLKKFRIVVV